MCRKRAYLLAQTALAVIVASFISVISSRADSVIKSTGTLILNGGEIAVYAQDITYLQNEIETLKSEIPAY